MNQMAFVTAAYAITAVSVGALVLWSWLAMRRAEARLEAASRA